jgi:Predicted Zn peptidase
MDVDLVAVGTRLHDARIRIGLSQRALGDAAGVSQSTVHRVEAGARTRVTLVELDRLAQALGVTLEELLYGSSVRDRIRAAARCTDGAQIQPALEHVIALLELDDRLDGAVTGLRQTRLWARVEPPSSGTPRARAEVLAGQVREILGLGVAPIAQLAEVVEVLTGVDVGTAPLPDGVSGVCAVDPQRETVILLINSDEVADRQRFTLAHELGHLLFGDPAHVHTVSTSRTSAEVRCDEFARNLLLPKSGVLAWLEQVRRVTGQHLLDRRQVALLTRHFGVTPEVVSIQLDRMKLRHAALTPMPSGRALAHRYGWGAQYEQDQVAARQPRVPRRLLDRAIEACQAGRLGVSVIARLQGRPVAEVEQELTGAGITARPAVRRADVAALVTRAARTSS